MSFVNSLKNFVGMGDEDEDYEDDEYMEYEEEEEEPKRRTSTFSHKPSKVIPVSSGNNAKVRIVKPKSFEDATKIADEIKGNRLVIFDVTGIDSDEARRIVDFVVGSAYGINGNVRRVSGGIFVAAPHNIDITGDNLKEQTRSSFDWNV